MANTANPSNLQALGFKTEVSFAEQTDSYDTAVRVSNLDISGITWPLLERETLLQRQNDDPGPGVRGAKGGSFTFEMEIYGHGTSTSGSLTATPQFTLLGNLLGGSDATSVGTTVATGGWNDATSGDTDGGTFPDGSVFFVGTNNDGRAEGQAGVTDTFVTNTLTSLVDLPAAPDAGDVVYAAQQLYPADSASVSTTYRFLLASDNVQVWARGCVLAGVEFSGLSEGQIPKVSCTINVASWDYANETFPLTTSSSPKEPIQVGGGSFFIEDKGTTTRSTWIPRDFSLSIDYQVAPLMGPATTDEHQNITGWRRLQTNASVSFNLEAEATGTQTWADYWDTDENSISAKHFLYTLATPDGRRMALYAPAIRPIEDKPTQTDVEGLNYVPVNFACYNSDDTGSDLTLSNIRLAFG